MTIVKKSLVLWVVGLIILSLGLSSFFMQQNEKIKLTVSAASSMSSSLKEIKMRFEAEHPEIEIYYNFGGTGTLRRQLEQGAPSDVFLAASKRDFDALSDQGHFLQSKPLLQNRLVLVGLDREGDAFTTESVLQSDGRLAIGTPGAVPAGTYAKQALERLGSWEALTDQGRFVYAKDARHVVQLVEQGMVDYGVVYQSDTLNVNVPLHIIELDADLHQPIYYFVGQVTERRASQQFYDFLLESETTDLLQEYGFQSVPADRKQGDV